jgi:hypothetical protein
MRREYLLALAFLRFAEAQTGSVAGQLVDGQGIAVVGGDISLTSLSERAGAPGLLVQRSGPGGAFSFSGLIPGPYAICASLLGSDLLNPCEWSTPPRIAVVDGATLGNLVIPMSKGREIRFSIHDPAEHVAANKNKGNGASLLVGVWSGRGFHRARELGGDRKKREYAIFVPVGKAVKLGIHGQRYALADRAGKAIGNAPDVEVAPASAIDARSLAPQSQVFEYFVKEIRP